MVVPAGSSSGTRLSANLDAGGSHLFYALEQNSPTVAVDSGTGALVLKQRVVDPQDLPTDPLTVTLRRDIGFYISNSTSSLYLYYRFLILDQ